MSTAYRAVGWNRQKRRYDATIATGVATYLGVFIAGGLLLDANATIETVTIRAFGTAALLLLHVVLAVGPLCRLDSRFLPLLYNRRHLGVTTFVLALTHGVFALIQFHALGDVNPLVSMLVTSREYSSLTDFPFQQLGLVAVAILFLMAATSHDFWLRAVSAPVWKTLHMLVYVAYGLVVAHVALGALQAERSPVLSAMLIAGVIVVLSLHLTAAWRERRRDRAREDPRDRGFVDVCAVGDIPDNRARIVCLSGERVAVFKYNGQVSAVSNVCRHQNGPLGEGKIVNGCIVCPWHGYEYEPASGRAPAPFSERLPTFDVCVLNDRVLVHPSPHPPGTYIEPAVANAHDAGGRVVNDEFYIGYEPLMPASIARLVRAAAVVLLALGLFVSGVLVFAQGRFAPATFEFGRPRVFEGQLVEFPYPALIARTASGHASTVYWLVGPGKHGAQDFVKGHDGRHVTLSGMLIERDGDRMIEIASNGAMTIAGASEAPFEPLHSLGSIALVGEIVDGKCHLGVMKPGEGPTHRDCAVRCLLGRVMPMIATRERGGASRRIALVDRDGRPFSDSLDGVVGRPVDVRGELLARGPLRFVATSGVRPK